MRFRKWPWPTRVERKHRIDCAVDDYAQTVFEGAAVDATISNLRAMREANHFRIRFSEALRG